MTIEQRVLLFASETTDEVFLRSDFAGLGSTAQVGRALRQLIEQGILVRFGFGVYAKAKLSILNRQPIPVRPVSELAPEALRKLGIGVYPCKLVREYNAGKITQLPAASVINTGHRRINRKLAFGKHSISYENDYTSTA